MVSEIPSYHRLQPPQRPPDFLVHPLPQLRQNILQLGCHRFADRLPMYRVIARLSARPTDVGETRKTEAPVLDSVSSPITKRVYNLGLDEFFAWFAQGGTFTCP